MSCQRAHDLGVWTARPMRRSDAPIVLEVFSDPDVVKVRSAAPPRDRADAERWIDAGAARGDLRWVLEDRSGRAGGIFVLQDVRNDVGAAEAGCVLLPHARGTGLGTAALDAVTAWAFDELGLVRVWLVHDEDNVAARRAAIRAGFDCDEITVAPRRRLDGSYVGQERRARTRPEASPCG